MKKQMFGVMCVMAALTSVPAIAATNTGARAASSIDFSNRPATRTRTNTNVNYNKYQTRTTTKTYETKDAKNIYYSQPQNRSALYKNYDAARTNKNTTVRTTRSETLRTELKRKYFLAHPFFQPLGRKFGSITDLSYNNSSYKVALTPTAGASISDANAKWTTDQFAIKEDFSYGITDRIAVLGMLRYDSSKYKFDWSNPTTPNDSMDDNGLNMFGLGAQWRFVDNDKWIATASAYYQHQKDVSNDFILDIKGGYKIGSSTIYGLGRAWYMNFDGDAYGNSIMGKTADGRDAGIFLAYKTDTSSALFVEGGLGVFTVLDQDWTFNLEAIFGNYDWHNQASLKAAIGWQPNDWVAINLYGKASIYDSADDKTISYYGYGVEYPAGSGTYLNQWLYQGDAKISDYTEMNIGLQAIFQF